MTTEETWKGVRSRIKIYLEERDKLKNEILEHRAEILVPEIAEKVWDLYMGKMSDFRQDTVLGENAMKVDLFEYYMILCHSYDIIPKF